MRWAPGPSGEHASVSGEQDTLAQRPAILSCRCIALVAAVDIQIKGRPRLRILRAEDYVYPDPCNGRTHNKHVLGLTSTFNQMKALQLYFQARRGGPTPIVC